MDKEFVKKNGLMESMKKFQRLVEYTYTVGDNISEDGEEMPDMGMDNNGGMMDGSQNGGQEGGAPDMMGGGDMSGMNMGGTPDMGMDGSQDGMGGTPDMNMGGAAAPEGFAPQGDGAAMGANPDTMPEEDEEVIDVDELVDSQEETEDKIEKLTSKFENLMNKIEDFESKVDASNERMETLRAEIEKRNPTPVEKLSLRAKDSYPFNVTPDEYWKDKEATSNYSTEDDKNGEDDRIYQITKDEIDNFNDYASAYKSLDKYTLNDLFGY